MNDSLPTSLATPTIPGPNSARAATRVFVTVGSDGPFDRLIQTIDEWAGQQSVCDVFAQIGESTFRPRHIRFSPFLEPPEFNRSFQEASVIVAHAGMGTILSALRYGKPILVMPRRASLGEQRNEHQLATATNLAKLGKISVAMDEHELRDRLEHLDQLAVLDRTGPYASRSLTDAIRTFIDAPR